MFAAPTSSYRSFWEPSIPNLTRIRIPVLPLLIPCQLIWKACGAWGRAFGAARMICGPRIPFYGSGTASDSISFVWARLDDCQPCVSESGALTLLTALHALDRESVSTIFADTAWLPDLTADWADGAFELWRRRVPIGPALKGRPRAPVV